MARRFAMTRPWLSALTCTTLLAACTAEAPAPTPIEEGQPAVLRPRRDPVLNARNPQFTDPVERGGDQLPKEEIDAILERVAQYETQGRESMATVELRQCANKIPASARCDGKLGALLSKSGSNHPEADYLLIEASKTDDPDAPATLYDEVGEALRRRGKFEEAAAALSLALAHEPTAARHAARSGALQGKDAYFVEAAEELRKAYELDPTHHQWLLDRATLFAQHPSHFEASIPLYQEYLKKTEGEDPVLTKHLEQRVEYLEQQVEKLKAAKKQGKPADQGPDEAPAQTPAETNSPAL